MKSEKEAPLLIDRLKAQLLAGKPIQSVFPGFKSSTVARMATQEAKVFNIDRSAVETALTLRPEMLRNRRWALPDLALVPYEATWLEYDPQWKVPNYDPALTSKKVGHLLSRYQGGVSVVTLEQGPDDAVVVLPFVFGWREPGALGPPVAGTWRVFGSDDLEASMSDACAGRVRAALLTGGAPWEPWWSSRMFGWLREYRKLKPNAAGEIDWSGQFGLSDGARMVLQQSLSAASLCMTLLALIAWHPAPKGLVQTRPPGRWWHRQTTRPYSARTLVTIQVPLKKVQQSLAAAGRAMARKRQHEVREHWRHLRTGVVVKVREHVRGDASLGVVTHDYVVRGGGGGETPGAAGVPEEAN